jgi:hypothetical protein
VFLELDEAIGRNEGDPEIRELLLNSVGLNLGMDFLPGAAMFDPAAGDSADPTTASKAVWFDAFVTNVDRTARNANLLQWHKQLYFIDHGASLFFHHNWRNIEQEAVKPFFAIKEHVLLRWASRIANVDAELRAALTEPALRQIVAAVPPSWLPEDNGPSIEGYLQYFQQRLAEAPFAEEAKRAYEQLV